MATNATSTLTHRIVLSYNHELAQKTKSIVESTAAVIYWADNDYDSSVVHCPT